MKKLSKKEMYSVIIAVVLIVGSVFYIINKANSNEALDAIAFFDKLEKYEPGIRAENTSKVIFFNVEAKNIKIGEGKIQIFEYPSAEEMEKEASRISDDGYQVKNVMINWIKPPHFYKKDSLLIVYLGENRSIMDELEKIVGKQFKGK